LDPSITLTLISTKELQNERTDRTNGNDPGILEKLRQNFRREEESLGFQEIRNEGRRRFGQIRQEIRQEIREKEIGNRSVSDPSKPLRLQGFFVGILESLHSMAPLLSEESNTRSFDLQLVFLVWLSMLMFGAVVAPIPAVNEPHYLCKAKHFWQPEWGAKDAFLASPNAHVVFYMAVGWLTKYLSLEQTAVIARAIATLVLALGWVSLTAKLLTARWSPLAACWLFCCMASYGSLSGEWIVGGVEGKVFSYGLLFAAFGQVCRGRIILAGALAGTAISFHPVIGAWCVLAFFGAYMTRDRWSVAEPEPIEIRPIGTGKTVLPFVYAVAAMIALALPGLIPVLQLLFEAVPAQTRFSANYIQVYYRLAHHLDPMLFPRRAFVGYTVLISVWLVLARARSPVVGTRWFHHIVGWSILFAIFGFFVSWGPRPPNLMSFYAERMFFLKFYPFRLADVAVPLAVSVVVQRWLEQRSDVLAQNVHAGRIGKVDAGRWGDCCSVSRFAAAYGPYALLWAFTLGHAYAGSVDHRGASRADWINVCGWIDQHLPADSLVQAPHNGWAFKWFAGRAEYVSFKDCPQDYAGIVEWNRRLLFLKKWYEDQYSDQLYSVEELRRFRRETGITHLLTDRLGPLELDPVYRNRTFQLYDLSQLD